MSVRDTYALNQPCPCGSGNNAGSCCRLFNGSWRKAPRSATPAGPVTGVSNPKCYMRATGNCSDNISKEHYISRSVLASLDMAGTQKIAGVPWRALKAFHIVPTDSLVAKVLCERHNVALSPLDAEAGRLIRTIGEYDRKFHKKPHLTEIKLFCGEELEKWMLKTVCGIVAAKAVARGGVRSNATVSDTWVSILAGERDWPRLWGIYVAVPTGVAFHYESFSFKPFSHPETEQVLAAELTINNFVFYILLGRPDSTSAWGTYRPRTLIFERDGVQKFIEMSWCDPRLQRYVAFSRYGSYSGPPPGWPDWAREG